MENTTKELTAPTVHLNGTGRADLLAGYEAAYRAVGEALDTVQKESYPNARDYYVQGPSAFTKAQNEHASRLARLLTVKDELMALYLAVEEAK